MSALPSTRGPYANGIRRRQQILDAATEVFALRGYPSASLREIAEAVGVTPAALLRHFASKEDLLLAVLQHWDDAPSSDGGRARPSEGLAYFDILPLVMDRHRDRPGLVELFLKLCTEASDLDHPARSWVVQRYDRIIAEAVDALAAAERLGQIPPMTASTREVEARALFAIMDGLELQWIASPDIDLGRMFRPLFESTLARWRGSGAPRSASD